MDVLLIRTGLCDAGGEPRIADNGREREELRSGRAVDQGEGAAREDAPYL